MLQKPCSFPQQLHNTHCLRLGISTDEDGAWFVCDMSSGAHHQRQSLSLILQTRDGKMGYARARGRAWGINSMHVHPTIRAQPKHACECYNSPAPAREWRPPGGGTPPLVTSCKWAEPAWACLAAWQAPSQSDLQGEQCRRCSGASGASSSKPRCGMRGCRWLACLGLGEVGEAHMRQQ